MDYLAYHDLITGSSFRCNKPNRLVAAAMTALIARSRCRNRETMASAGRGHREVFVLP